MNFDRTAMERRSVETSSGDPLDEGARETLITEEEFGVELVAAVERFSRGAEILREVEPLRWPKRYFHLLEDRAEELETFLDDHDARHNRRFCLLAEVVASIRGFASATHTLYHLRVRLPKYRVQLGLEQLEEFQKAVRGCHEFLCRSLSRLLGEMGAQLISLDVEEAVRTRGVEARTEEPVRRHLPHDLEDEQVQSDEARVAAILTLFMQAVSRFERAENMRPEDTPESIDRFAREVYCETEARAVEAAIHNIQSAYDTHVKFTQIEGVHPDLRAFRGHISLALHLLEIGTRLVHFTERHENVIQHRVARERISELIDPVAVQREAIFFALYNASRILIAARPMVSKLLDACTQREAIELEIPPGEMLHARPLSLIVAIVRHHGTAVDMVVNGDSTSANSIMGLIMLVGRHTDCRLVKFQGDHRPLRDLRLLFEAGLGEGGIEKLPDELSYLR